MKWRVWITGYPDGIVEIDEGAMPMSPITAMARAARELKAHWHGEIIEMNARPCEVVARIQLPHKEWASCLEWKAPLTSRFVRIDRNGNLSEAS